MIGIDVSEHNDDDIDFTQYDFVILRANWWTTTDKKFDQFADKLEELGIPYGVYCYDYCGDEASALEQAEYTFSLIKDRNIQMGVWMDMEDADGWKQKNGYLTKEHCSMVCKVFCDFLRPKVTLPVSIVPSIGLRHTVLQTILSGWLIGVLTMVHVRTILQTMVSCISTPLMVVWIKT